MNSKRLSFFFFQAEDGIRDLTVTGVQTCALPISAALRRRRQGRHQPRDRARRAAQDARLDAEGGERRGNLGQYRARQDRRRAQPVRRGGGRRQAPGKQAGISDQETFISHLIELRSRLVRAVAVVLAIFVVLFIWPGSGRIYDALALPLMRALPEGATMIAIGVITPFMVPVKVTALVAFMIALPYVLYQAWAFVAPGLYEHEKRLALPLVIGSTALFLLGVAFCYFFVFGRVFAFIHGFAPK